ncbi:hypothetical protein L2E82_20328 [Cichorium intybus]|uniref:Uncharacterized protein n=1 Tax=Cichorium intybus TaxID=13427 RepID=A0ACB9DTV6_CICIN|nr:hypothetical protein L2E82_20328 [Cichorium intybus]
MITKQGFGCTILTIPPEKFLPTECTIASRRYDGNIYLTDSNCECLMVKEVLTELMTWKLLLCRFPWNPCKPDVDLFFLSFFKNLCFDGDLCLIKDDEHKVSRLESSSEPGVMLASTKGGSNSISSLS